MLDTYANLKLELAAWTSHADLDKTSGGIDTYIDLFESWVNRNLRVRQQIDQTSALTVSAGGSITHPANWAAWKQIAVMNTPIAVLPATSEDAILRFDNSNGAGFPKKHVVRGVVTQVWPAPDTTYTYRGIWFSTITPLDGSHVNWLLTAYPDAYLLGSLVYGFGLLQDDARIPMWKAGLGQVLDEITTASLNDEFSTGIDSPTIRNVV